MDVCSHVHAVVHSTYPSTSRFAVHQPSGTPMSVAAACAPRQTAEEEVEEDNQEDEMGQANGDAGAVENHGAVGQSQVCLPAEPE